jgi:hypothetical protein
MPKSVLVIEAGASRLRAAIARASLWRRVDLGPFAVTEGTNGAAFDAILAQLGGGHPRRALVVTAEARPFLARGGERPRVTDDDLVCAWSALPRSAGWLGAALPHDAREAWAALLARRGIALDGIYPMLGAAAAAIPPKRARDRVLLHVGAGAAAWILLEAGSIASLRVVAFADAVSEAPAVSSEILVCGRDPEPVARALAATRDAVVFDPCPGAPGGGSAWASVLGAARHALRAAAEALAVRVPPAPARARAWFGAPLRLDVARR